ncbi:MAG: Glycoside hydrolase family 1 protein [Candidatus Magasanikbacteria bacterium]|nr:Glycoside hydrolase family 1 protein [Candidatus Magasanikbacteria bacterium]
MPRSQTHPLHRHETLRFPKDFLWGAATSSHQVEGWNEHNDWWEWEKRVGSIARGERSGRSADHYHHYEHDFDLAKQLNLGAYRLSLEWSRLEPHKNGWDRHEVEHYQNVLCALKARGFKVMLTLMHFTLPQWVAEEGGWENLATVKYFERYAEFAVKNFGPYVDFWVTVNEPLIAVTLGYLRGRWPPGKKSLLGAFQTFLNLTRAHKRVYHLIHQLLDKEKRSAVMKIMGVGGKRGAVCVVRPPRQVQVGVAHNIVSVSAYRKHSLVDSLFARLSDFLWNHLFISMTRRTHDFLGVNYYFHQRLKREKGKFFRSLVDVYREETRETSDIGWEIFPQGISEALLDLSAEYPKIPIYITENGIATVNDDKRSRFIVSYIKEIYHAIQAGVDVRGYFYWSLIDNFEWEKGFSPRFGLIEIDYKTLRRRVRPAARVYAAIAKENGLPHELLRFIGHGVAPTEFL